MYLILMKLKKFMRNGFIENIDVKTDTIQFCNIYKYIQID